MSEARDEADGDGAPRGRPGRAGQSPRARSRRSGSRSRAVPGGCALRSSRQPAIVVAVGVSAATIGGLTGSTAPEQSAIERAWHERRRRDRFTGDAALAQERTAGWPGPLEERPAVFRRPRRRRCAALPPGATAPALRRLHGPPRAATSPRHADGGARDPPARRLRRGGRLLDGRERRRLEPQAPRARRPAPAGDRAASTTSERSSRSTSWSTTSKRLSTGPRHGSPRCGKVIAELEAKSSLTPAEQFKLDRAKRTVLRLSQTATRLVREGSFAQDLAPADHPPGSGKKRGTRPLRPLPEVMPARFWVKKQLQCSTLSSSPARS